MQWVYWAYCTVSLFTGLYPSIYHNLLQNTLALLACANRIRSLNFISFCCSFRRLRNFKFCHHSKSFSIKVSELKAGHALTFCRLRGSYHHWAIVVEVQNNFVTIMEYQSGNGLVKAKIDEQTIEFIEGARVNMPYLKRAGNLSSGEVVERAREMVGVRRYNLVTHNCHDFVRYCFGRRDNFWSL